MLPADSFLPALNRVTEILDRLEIRYHLTGGITAIVYGEPRMTQDIDLVLDPDAVARLEGPLLNALEDAGFEFSSETAKKAIADRKMFQLLDPELVLKLDLYVRCLIPGELERSGMVEISPGSVFPVASRRDAALSKLIWIDHGSHRSRRDLRRLFEGGDSDEQRTIRESATAMGMQDLLDEVLAESDELDI